MKDRIARLRRHFDSTAWVCSAVLLIAVAAGRLPHLPLPKCPWRMLLGIQCPGCGLTRAFVALAQGDLRAAWTFHPWAFPLFAGAVWFAARPWWLALRAGKPSARAVEPTGKRGQPWLTLAVLAAFSGWALWRALP